MLDNSFPDTPIYDTPIYDTPYFCALPRQAHPLRLMPYRHSLAIVWIFFPLGLCIDYSSSVSWSFRSVSPGFPGSHTLATTPASK